MKKEMCTRTLNIEMRSEESEGKRFIYGFIPFNSPSQRMFLGYSGCKYEVLKPTVFNKTLGDKLNVFANYDHDNGKILGSTKAGTLELKATEDGLECRCEVPNTSWGNDAWEIITRGDVTTMSFEFIPYDYEENFDEDTCYLKSAKLTAVSFCVANPAYTETDSMTAFRSLCAKRNVDFDKLIKDKDLIEKVFESISAIENEKNNVREVPEENPASEQPPKEDIPTEEEQKKLEEQKLAEEKAAQEKKLADEAESFLFENSL